ncbi:hypothetical protein PHYSODRAFT_524667 [Phytophthora sojae]|uniref:Uncharacterized protein n=1 Tax=Phytophthora sojae (strain P6497) TaxID=1094619 RepID=G5A5I1_PHYSP|nr:hypothetical protein PHYSODRAFT_524667 [Phytophthora sojae]EGZ08586.1 hypothetical protein PHYSODRAFT_524667 [Phytophthora sojae]|eukprot:XP_009535219.1 hypothetical protein PHYSODRAFT_524667 [Phytophthora sojae]
MQELIGLTVMQLRGEGPRYWDLRSGDEEGIFADLLVLVARTRMAIQRRQVENPRSVLSFATWGISVGEPHVRADSEAGLVLETHACSLLPFSVTTTAAAHWRMFSLPPVNHENVSNDIENSDVFARIFTCSSNHFGRSIHVRGKHICRRYPRFQHGNVGQTQRAREIIEWASKSQHSINDWYRQKLGEVLVEEDWKAFRGGDADEVAV